MFSKSTPCLNFISHDVSFYEAFSLPGRLFMLTPRNALKSGKKDGMISTKPLTHILLGIPKYHCQLITVKMLLPMPCSCNFLDAWNNPFYGSVNRILLCWDARPRVSALTEGNSMLTVGLRSFVTLRRYESIPATNRIFPQAFCLISKLIWNTVFNQ